MEEMYIILVNAVNVEAATVSTELTSRIIGHCDFASRKIKIISVDIT